MLRWREFITLLGGAVASWPLAARGQQGAMPVVGYVRSGARTASAHLEAAFRQGLHSTGFEEGHRKLVRDDPPPHRALQGMSLEQNRARHDLQTR
jgi:hypothetical protein